MDRIYISSFFVIFEAVELKYDIMSAINEYLKRLASIFGSMGFSVPPDDFSGVVIDGKTYPVMMRNDGCYVYFDDKGVKRLVSDVPRKDYQFINIKDARVSIVNQCYRTPGGQVEARIHTYMNNKGEILAEKIFIVNSSDVDTPIGTELDKVPAEWVAIDCSIAEMTDRELIFVSKCYATEGGKVQIEGVESVDPRLNPEVSHYEVVNTTDDSNPIGTEYDAIPDTWNRIVCDFPDMTQREIIPVLKCFDTGTGRVQIEGYKIFDYEMGTRKEWYRIKQSTDPENPVGEFITSISDDWVEVVCDFTDMEDRNVQVYRECYAFKGQRIEVDKVVSYDGDLGDRKAKYIVRESEDGAILIDQEYDEIPVGWKKSPCDLENLRDRHVSYYDQCYVTENDKRVKIHNIVIYNSLGYEWYHFYEVTQSEDDKYEVGDINSSMIDKWSRVECEMPDMENRFLDTTDTCYDTGNGTVKIRRQESIDYKLNVREFDYKIVESTDPDHPTNTTPTQDTVSGWTVISCDLNIMEVDDCYEVGGHKIHLKGFRTVNPALQDIKSILYVVYSDHPDYHAGDELNSIPEGAKVTICDYADKSQRHMVPVRECYEVADGRFYVEGSRLVDNNMVVERTSVMVLESSSPTYPVGTTLTSIPDGATIVACLCQTC